ncbi:30S ribosomal protein S2 [uncultured Algimonas sp.]|uniref:30S ribosomal protein S2 n=1 Tax=uncultured Algimonas sp. TaxID=1547920 RepID=UPI00344E24E3
MALPEFSMRQLLEAGVHFGHQTHRWNPKMAPYIFGARSNIHILDLSQTVPLLHQALKEVRDVAAKGGRVLFVGTKRAASEPIAQAAQRCAQYYVNHRWLGGMLTNWQTVSGSIARLKQLDAMDPNDAGLTKKELLNLARERERLDRTLGGIKDMGGKPDLMFVIDTNKESIAIKEARRLGIPVVAILDTNCNPSEADIPIPGNDDAARAIQLYCELMADAVLDGMTEAAAAVGMDLGAAENPEEMALELADTVPAEEEAVAAEIAEAASEPVESPATEALSTEPATSEQMADVALKLEDIALIDGIGPVYKEKLEAAGINSLEVMANLSDEKVAEIDESLGLNGKLKDGDFRDQAKALLNGDAPQAAADKEALKAAS